MIYQRPQTVFDPSHLRFLGLFSWQVSDIDLRSVSMLLGGDVLGFGQTAAVLRNLRRAGIEPSLREALKTSEIAGPSSSAKRIVQK